MNRKIFLLDSLGALVLVVFAIVIYFNNSLIGIAKSDLILLLPIPFLFFGYSFSCYRLISNNRRKLLLIFAYANLLYALILLAFIVYHNTTITKIGIIYFISEMIILITLAIWELKVANIGVQ